MVDSTMTGADGVLQNSLRIKKVDSVYTPHQVSQWLACINFPGIYSEQELASGGFPTTLDHLFTLVRLSLVKFPYENTDMH